MTLRKETIEKLRRARENHDEEEARKFTQSLPEAKPLAKDETMVVFNPPTAKKSKKSS